MIMFVCHLMTKAVFYLLFILLLSTNSLAFDLKKDSIYLKGSVDKGIILAHGKGKHPRWLVVEPIRQGINKQLAWHSLSLQMPVTKNDDGYKNKFDDAYNRIQTAINYLKNKNIKTIVLVGHSLGARMMSAFVAKNKPQINGLVVLGCRNNGGYPFACDKNLTSIKIPVLDIYGNENNKDTKAAKEREHLVAKNYQQTAIDFTGHLFTSSEDELVEVIVDWLKRF